MNSPEEVILADVVPEDSGSQPKTTFIEQILSPANLQRTMQLGGGLLVLGFVFWLWSIGLFDNPLVVATLLGGLTLGILGVGVAMVRYTRHQLAGTALTLLGALAMPLNLWFYDAQGLITIANGGHLWVPAALCCGIYALVARALRRPAFVYAFVGGIVMTGMLFLADASIAQFWELIPQSTLLLVVGWLCVHSERLFAEEEGDFSRARFGRAFRNAGFASIVGGLGLVLSGQIASLIQFAPTMNDDQKMWGCGLIGASCLGFSAECLLRRNRWQDAAIAFGLLGWCVLTLLDAISIPITLPLIGGVMSIALILRRVVVSLFVSDADEWRGGDVAWWMTILVSGLAIIQFVSQFTGLAGNLVFAKVGFAVVTQLILAAVACWATARKVSGNTRELMLVGAGIATMAGISMGLATQSYVYGGGIFSWIAICGLVVPVSLVVASMFHFLAERTASSVSEESNVDSIFHLVVSEATAVSLVTLLLTLGIMGAAVSFAGTAYLDVAWLLAASATLFSMAAHGSVAKFNRFAAVLCSTSTIAVVMAAAGMGFDYSAVLSATIGGAVLAVYAQWCRLGAATQVGEGWEVPANLMVSVGGVAAIMLAISRLIDGHADVYLLAMLFIQVAGIAAAGLLTHRREWRLFFRALAAATVLAATLTVHVMIPMTFLHRLEVGSLIFGFALLVIGHIAWVREGDDEDASATLSLWCGSLLAAIPIGLGLFYYRACGPPAGWNWPLFHEISVVVVGLSLFVAGTACRIRATTISGAGLLTLYFVSLVGLFQLPAMLHNVSVVMMVSGAAFFLIALLLSIYRDRVAGLPEDIRAGRGVFRVLRWR